MEDELERAFDAHQDKTERHNWLVYILQDGGSHSGFFHEFREVYRVYEDWKRSGYVVWPFPGGRLSQPKSWLHDLDAMGYREEFYKLHAEIVRKSDALPFDAIRTH